MLKRLGQSGVTLIEVIIAITIASAMIPIILTGQREIRSRAQFSDGVERLRNNLVQIKNEANTTVSNSQTSTGTTINTVVAGRLVDLNNVAGALRLRVTPLLLHEDRPDTQPDKLTLDVAAAKNIDIPWQVSIDASQTATPSYLVFLRNDDNGLLQTFFPPIGSATRFSAYATVPGSVLDLHLRDPDGHTAVVSIDQQFGSVTRTIQ
jgi:prepilin-type N-terminal cleavage/methylation domain-containing protein